MQHRRLATGGGVVANPKALIARAMWCGDVDDHSSEDPNFLMAMTVGSRFSIHASKRLRILARRSSALEHPGWPIAARAYDSKWHTTGIFAVAAIATAIGGYS